MTMTNAEFYFNPTRVRNSSTHYSTPIAALAPGYDAGQIESYMRLECGSLSHLTRAKFTREVRLAKACIDANPAAAVRLAASYGL